MMMENVRERLEKLLAESDFTGSKGFVLLGDRGRLDSVAALRLVLSLENEFGIVVEDSEIRPQNFSNIHRLESYLRRKLGKRGEAED